MINGLLFKNGHIELVKHILNSSYKPRENLAEYASLYNQFDMLKIFVVNIILN